MADFGTGVLPPAHVKRLGTAFTVNPIPEITFGTGVQWPPVAVVPPVVRIPGDYMERPYWGPITTSRTTVYTVPSDVERCVIREMRLVNTTAAAITAELWVGGRKLEPGISVPANEPRKDTTAGIMLKAGEVVEARASAAGLDLYIFAAEEVV